MWPAPPVGWPVSRDGVRTGSMARTDPTLRTLWAILAVGLLNYVETSRDVMDTCEDAVVVVPGSGSTPDDAMSQPRSGP